LLAATGNKKYFKAYWYNNYYNYYYYCYAYYYLYDYYYNNYQTRREGGVGGKLLSVPQRLGPRRRSKIKVHQNAPF